ncbi:translational GTPase TypA, partial [Candidatus Collierbacteria bacterium]|nr:translational GTPase TypA [Candidatus Collierbacteria bacterium]
ADGALLIVDAQEGPMPQTRFVLKKAFEMNLKIIVIINKIDKKYARVNEVINKTNNLFLELATKDEQLDFPILYAVGRDGKAFTQMPADFNQEGDITPLLDAIIKYIPEPANSEEGPFKTLVSSLDYDPHKGRIVVGKIFRGSVKPGDKIILSSNNRSYHIEYVLLSKGLSRHETEIATAGDIVALTGIADAKIGDTIANPADQEPLPAPKLTDPTLHMTINTNTSPVSGKEGQFTTNRQLEERLFRELETNLSLKLEKQDGKFKISGRGELHLAILLENLRREGYEMEVGKPEVIIRENNHVKEEPVEEVDIIAPKEYLGTITQEIGKRLGRLVKMEPISETELEFVYQMPTRTIIGLRSLLLTATKGTVIFSSQVIGYQPLGEPLPKLRRGALIAAQTGDALAYGLQNAQGRGITFIDPGTKVYEGMVIGLNAKDEDIEINVTKGVILRNVRLIQSYRQHFISVSTFGRQSPNHASVCIVIDPNPICSITASIQKPRVN